MSNTANATAAYANFFKSWAVNLLGAKPTAAQFEAVHGLGLRPGKQALANAMALRDKGVTNAQIVIACGNPQLNKMRDLITDAYVKRDMHVAKSPEGHTVYKLELTAKGKAKIERTAKAAAALEAAGAAKAADKPKAVKAKGAAAKKPAKAKPVTVEATSEAATVTVNVPEADTAQAATA